MVLKVVGMVTTIVSLITCDGTRERHSLPLGSVRT